MIVLKGICLQKDLSFPYTYFSIWTIKLMASLSTAVIQTSANWGPDLRFVIKLSRSSIMITLHSVHLNHNSQSDSNLSNYQNFHTCLHEYLLV